jgi:hypothetical protein
MIFLISNCYAAAVIVAKEIDPISHQGSGYNDK